MNDIEYLQTVHVIKLQQAARMAGLRWKSGTPGYDKAGIIEKLSHHPSILRATIATLQRMEQGIRTPAPTPAPKGVGSLLDDIEQDAEPMPAEPVESLPAPITPVPAPVGGVDQNTIIELIRRALDPRDKTIAAHADTLRQHDRTLNNQGETLDGLIKAVLALQDRKPVQIVINGQPLPPISGQHFMFVRMVKWLSLREINRETRSGYRTHVILIGPASSGKTTAALEFAKLKGLELYAQPLSMDSFAVLGYTSPDGARIDTEFTRAWINGGVYLWDEVSMSSPEAVGTLNAALANGFASIPGLGTVKSHPDFYFIAGDNSDTGASIKFGARSLLDGASLDRFQRLAWPIDEDIEAGLAGSHVDWLHAVRAIRTEIDKRDIAHVGATMRATIAGSMALSSGLGFTRREILEDSCKKGALVEQWADFERLPAVQAFLRGGK